MSHPNERLFRFFFWNDIHLRAPHLFPEHRTYPLANEKAAWAVECALGKHELEPPDFVLSGGDIINGEIPDYQEDFDYMKSLILDPIDVPFLPCVGNHENRQGEGITELNEAYDRFFGERWHHYTFTCGGIGFIVVDTSGAHRNGDEVTEKRNSFVDSAFAELDDLPVILVTHVPLIAARDLEPLKASFGFSSWKVLEPGLLETVMRNAERTIAVLCGHIHLTSVQEQSGVHQIMPGGIGGYPSDFAAFDVYADRIDMKMHSPPEEILDPAGNIHGKRRHSIDYTDSQHPTHHAYIWGNENERRVSIPLAGPKAPRESGSFRPEFPPSLKHQ
ncbi:MAG: metallophosphoesterase [Planctomycetota bacterium]|jgi:hypothetical protein|nr:metallophosphoesterase [Planctomycetota bacterium]MDP7128962.1 metallophosphoesterase [Planctomycetota bacterium]MDP7254225.1 metallophosphoesterase [Planctomycetota bacterium]